MKEPECLAAQLALKSIGYRSIPVEGVAFDVDRGIIPNRHGRQASTCSHTCKPFISFSSALRRRTTLCRSGRILTEQHVVDPRLYVCGWLGRGPSGIIGMTWITGDDVAREQALDMQSKLCVCCPGTNLADAEVVVKQIADDLHSNPDQQHIDSGLPDLHMLLEQRGVKPVSFQAWTQLDIAELQRGALTGKPREKFTMLQDMQLSSYPSVL